MGGSTNPTALAGRWKGGAERGPELPQTQRGQEVALGTRLGGHSSSSSPAVFLALGAAQHFSPSHTRPSAERPVRVPSPPGDIDVLPLLPHQSPPAPLGTTLGPESAGSAARPPPGAQKEPLCATMARLSPEPPARPAAPGLPHALGPSRDPLWPSGRAGGGRSPRAPRGCGDRAGGATGGGDLAGH